MSNRLDNIISNLGRAFGAGGFNSEEERAREKIRNLGLLSIGVDPSLQQTTPPPRTSLNTDDFGTPLDWNTGPMGEVYPLYQERDRILRNREFDAFGRGGEETNVVPSIIPTPETTGSIEVLDPTVPIESVVTPDLTTTPKTPVSEEPIVTPDLTATPNPTVTSSEVEKTGVFNPITIKGSVIGDLYNRIGDTAKKSELITKNVQKTLDLTQNLPPEEKKGFLDNLFQDKEKMLWLALGFNTMRLEPDDQLTKTIGKALEDIREGKGTNQTLDHLKKYHPDVHKLVQEGMSIKDAVSIARLKQPGGIHVGQIPKDYILKRDEKGNAYLEVIPGSDTAREMAERGKKDELKLHSTIDKADMINKNIDEAIAMVSTEDWATGIKGAFVRDYGGPFAAGSPAKNLQAMITHLQANIGFDKLQRMREESPTGGALGQVAVQELVALQATLGSLDLMQSPDMIIRTLKHVQNTYNSHMAIVLQQYGPEELAKYGIEYGPTDIKGSGSQGNDDPLGIR